MRNDTSLVIMDAHRGAVPRTKSQRSLGTRLEEMIIYKHTGQDEKRGIKLKAHHICIQTGCPMGCVSMMIPRFSTNNVELFSCLS